MQAKVFGVDFVFGDFAVFQLAHHGGCAQADFIHAIAAIHHQRVLGAQALQRAHLNAHQVGVEHAHEDVGCARRVGQWPQDVEQRAHAQFFAHRGDVFHRRVVVGRKHKANADLGNALRNLLGRQVDVDAQRLHGVGAAAFARHAAPAVLAHLGPRSRSHKHGAGGNVEGVGTVAAGAHDIHQMARVAHVHLGGKLAHHLRSGGNFANGFLLHAQAGEDGGRHQGRHLTAHDQAHEVQHLVMKNFAVLDGALQRFLGGDFVHGAISQNRTTKGANCSLLRSCLRLLHKA